MPSEALIRGGTGAGPADLLRFIAACGHAPRIVDLAPFERAPATAAG